MRATASPGIGGRRNTQSPAIVCGPPITAGDLENPEAQTGVIPADAAGRDSIELGCGTGYVSE